MWFLTLAAKMNFTTGKIESGVATLINDEMQLIEFPSSLLPKNVILGSIVQININKNLENETKISQEFIDLQKTIKEKYGKYPKNPILTLKTITQTSIEFSWEFNLQNCEQLGIDCYLNGVLVHSPLMKTPTSLKLHGLDMDKEYSFFICIRTSGGVLKSQTITQSTRSITDLSGLIIGFNGEKEKEICQNLGITWKNEFDGDNTHLISFSKSGENWEIASKLNIPVVTPDWVMKCTELGKMVPVRDYYPQ